MKPRSLATPLPPGGLIALAGRQSEHQTGREQGRSPQNPLLASMRFQNKQVLDSPDAGQKAAGRGGMDRGRAPASGAKPFARSISAGVRLQIERAYFSSEPSPLVASSSSSFAAFSALSCNSSLPALKSAHVSLK